jgi:hypothetical protein
MRSRAFLLLHAFLFGLCQLLSIGAIESATPIADLGAAADELKIERSALKSDIFSAPCFGSIFTWSKFSQYRGDARPARGASPMGQEGVFVLDSISEPAIRGPRAVFSYSV